MRNLVVQIEKWISIWQLVPVLYRVFRSPGCYKLWAFLCNVTNEINIQNQIHLHQPKALKSECKCIDRACASNVRMKRSLKMTIQRFS